MFNFSYFIFISKMNHDAVTTCAQLVDGCSCGNSLLQVLNNVYTKIIELIITACGFQGFAAKNTKITLEKYNKNNYNNIVLQKMGE